MAEAAVTEEDMEVDMGVVGPMGAAAATVAMIGKILTNDSPKKEQSDLNLSSGEAIVTVTDEVLPAETEAQRCVDSLHLLFEMSNHEKVVSCQITTIQNYKLRFTSVVCPIALQSGRSQIG